MSCWLFAMALAWKKEEREKKCQRCATKIWRAPIFAAKFVCFEQKMCSNSAQLLVALFCNDLKFEIVAKIYHFYSTFDAAKFKCPPIFFVHCTCSAAL